jgi:anti-sigma B factor antagonist
MDLIVHASEHGHWRVVSIGGEIDLATAPRLRNDLMRHLRRDRAGGPGIDAAVDLRGVGFIDSIGLGVLIGARRRVLESGGAFALVIDTPRIIAMLVASGLEGLFVVVASVDELGDPTPFE